MVKSRIIQSFNPPPAPTPSRNLFAEERVQDFEHNHLLEERNQLRARIEAIEAQIREREANIRLRLDRQENDIKRLTNEGLKFNGIRAVICSLVLAGVAYNTYSQWPEVGKINLIGLVALAGCTYYIKTFRYFWQQR